MSRVVAASPSRSRAVTGRTRTRSGPKSRTSRQAPTGRAVFVSHSSADKQLAGALVELLRNALDLSAGEILCTSVDGYRLKVGDDTDDTLRAEVLGAKVLIGLITPASQRSSYVLFELGARWGTKRHLIPLTARGASPGDLGGPLAGKNALDVSKRSGVQQFIGDLGTLLKRDAERPEAYEKDLGRVVRNAKKSATRRKGRRSGA